MNTKHNPITLDEISKIVVGYEQVARWRTNPPINPPRRKPRRSRPSSVKPVKDQSIPSKREAVCWRIARWIVLGAGTFCFTVISVLAADPGLPPGSNFDLTHWKLTLPDTNTTEIEPDELDAGFTNSFFYTGADGAMTLWCPVKGGVTGGSDYPRCELRELLDPGNQNVNWPGYGTNVLNAQCKVLKVPSSREVVIGQIHAFTGNAYPLVKLQYDDGNIDAWVHPSPNSPSEYPIPLGTVGISNLFTYELKLENGLLSMSVNQSNQVVDVFASDPAWTNQTFFFKAGSYCQDTDGPSTEGSTVAFYQMTVDHLLPPSPAQVISISNYVVNGDNISFTLLGQGGGSYFIQSSTDLTNWSFLLVTNSISGRIGFSDTVQPGPHFYRGGSF